MRSKISVEDLVDREARAIATEILERHLTAKGFPLPKESALELHLKHLIAADPSITALARERVDAKNDAYTAGLKTLGLNPPKIEAIDIEF